MFLSILPLPPMPRIKFNKAMLLTGWPMKLFHKLQYFSFHEITIETIFSGDNVVTLSIYSATDFSTL